MVTIFTPTYNRANTLVRTYTSLVNQTCKDFEWLIVDDGSADDTEILVKSWINGNDFPIRYIKQSNGGKYRAYNNGLWNAKGEFFFCVDSDDWLPHNAVEIISSYAENLSGNDSLAGIVALKISQDNKIIGSPFRNTQTFKSLYDLEVQGDGGERSIVFKTSVASMFPFPEETDEKFLGESVIYDQLHGKYKFLISNEILTCCEYQTDGLSSNPRKLMLQNPAGYKLYFSQRIDMAPTWYKRVSYILHYHAFRVLYGGEKFSYKGKYKFQVALLAPLSRLVKLYYSRFE